MRLPCTLTRARAGAAGAWAAAGNATALPRRYDSVRVYILLAEWNAERVANAERICGALVPSGVPCERVPAVRGDALSNASLAALEEEGVVTRAELPPPPPPWTWLHLPHAIAPLGPDYLPNQLNASWNWRWHKALGNTVGTVRCLQAMAKHAAALDALPRPAGAQPPSERVLYVYLEDDAYVADLPAFKRRVLDTAERLPRAWHLLLLAPPHGMCERSAWLPPPWGVRHGGIMAPRYAYSRTTGVVHSIAGVHALLDALPAFNIIDMWYRALMRAGKLIVRIHCDDIVQLGDAAARQARRRLIEA